MPQIKHVMTGEVASGRPGDVLRSSPIGSCVVVSVYSSQAKAGGMAHIMLPGQAPHEGTTEKMRYADNAINELLRQMQELGADALDLEICMAGAGNVLKRPDDTTAKNNLDSVVEILRDKKLSIKAQAVGGTIRRVVEFDIDKAKVFYTEGDGLQRLLWAIEGTLGSSVAQ